MLMTTMKKTVADMTSDDLKQLIGELLDERFEVVGDDFDIDDDDFDPDEEPDTRSLEEVLQSMREHRWTPPSGTPTPSQMIREDRDSQ